jgi:hypothetical protein
MNNNDLPHAAEAALPLPTCSASRDYIAELRQFIERLPADHDPLRTMEKIARFSHGALERLRSEKTEGYFNGFLEHN